MRDLPTPGTAEHRLAIATGISRRLIAARFKVSADAAWRHGREHLTAETRAALATKVLAREGDMHRILLEEGSGVVEALKAIRCPLFGMFLVAIDLRQARVYDTGDRCPVSLLLSRSEEYCERQVWGISCPTLPIAMSTAQRRRTNPLAREGAHVAIGVVFDGLKRGSA